jgi:uncharacterized protein (DUF952 family)
MSIKQRPHKGNGCDTWFKYNFTSKIKVELEVEKYSHISYTHSLTQVRMTSREHFIAIKKLVLVKINGQEMP